MEYNLPAMQDTISLHNELGTSWIWFAKATYVQKSKAEKKIQTIRLYIIC